MTIAELIKCLQGLPADAVVLAYNADEERIVPVTGLLHTPQGSWIDNDETGDSICCAGECVLIQTDAP